MGDIMKGNDRLLAEASNQLVFSILGVMPMIVAIGAIYLIIRGCAFLLIYAEALKGFPDKFQP